MLKQEEKMIKPHQESIKIVNLGSETEVKEVKVGVDLEDSVKSRLVKLLQEYSDIFVWSYEDMPRLDTDIFVHHFPFKEDSPPVK